MKGVTRQTEAMIEGAGPDRFITTGQHKDTGKHHGILMVNHPTPSGCDRYMMALSDNRGWDDKETAEAEFKKLLPPELKEG